MIVRSSTSRRTFVSLAVGAALVGARPARAATRVRFQMSWFAEAELGGFYQAKAMGLYDQAGLDVELMQGGPQYNAVQMLLGDQADVIVGYDLQALTGVEKNLPMRAIAASFQVDLQGLMARPEITSLAALKGHRVSIANSGYTTYWPWLKQKFGFTDDMARPKGINLQTFFADPTSAVAGYITAEPFIAQQRDVPVRFLLFSDEGWPTYTNPLIASDAFLAANPDKIRRFLQASMAGWKAYLSDPSAGNALIKQVNPKMDDAQIAFSLQRLAAIKAVSGGEAAMRGIGTMSAARWRTTRDMMVSTGLLKAETDWTRAFTTAYIDDVQVLPG